MLWDVFPDGEHFGGAPANVAVHAAGLGAQAMMISAVGQDARGDEALKRLAGFGVDTSAVARLADHPTGVVRVAVDADGVPSYDIAAGSAWDYIPWSAAVDRAAQRADAICFGTLAQRSPVSRATIRRAIAATRETAWRLFDVNLRQSFYDADVVIESLEAANALKLNEEELSVVARLCGLASGSAVAQLRALSERFELRLAALTQGGEGSVLVSAGDEWHAPAPKTRVVDTVGAGDAFTATLLVGILTGSSENEANQRANAVAAYVCSQAGATPPIPTSL
ncbi:MAG: carbohydrate kinase family protein [Gemmatimonadales bacterium]